MSDVQERPIRVAILGSTGSIGKSALEVLARHPGRFEVRALAANRSVDLLAEQATRFAVGRVVVADDAVFGRMGHLPRGWVSGREAVVSIVEDPEVDVVLNALVGFAGLEPTIRALRAGKRVALANKESLVAGGPLVLEARDAGGGTLVPVDSEHSAILQCLEGSRDGTVQRLIITASGGPFRGRSAPDLASVGPAQALRHPTWSMGAKITIDSATLANKALEVIEAHVLYGLPYSRIEAVVHPQSIIHSFVEFVDGSVLAQMGFPDMELPILYALTWPERLGDAQLRTFDPLRSSPLTFEALDEAAFPLFRVGVDAGERGGVAPTAFNAANEVAVEAFLSERISFPAMADAVSAAVEGVGSRDLRELDDVREADGAARRIAREWITRQEARASGAAPHK
ncbi:MAG: 1-deoxy-D-xylulose-5-phosphate reductoisomerase [Gemmatimonadales bacterium]|nr:MAG: 1-deoxy-D-xylulose-5-phosphate reductoisomerase [Gemmatimonadales bacterium]